MTHRTIRPIGAAPLLTRSTTHVGRTQPIGSRSPPARPQGPGRRGHLRLPRRRGTADLRRAVQAECHPPHSGSPGRRRGARSRGLRAQHRQGRRGAGDLRPRRHQRGDRPVRRADGFHPDRLPDGPGAHPPDRQRRLPGSRHHRHHPPSHQAQLPGEARRGFGAGGARGILRRAVRPAGPGGDRPAEGHRDRQGALRGGRGVPPELPPADRARPWPDRQGDRPAEVGEAADGLHRRRRDQRRPRGLGRPGEIRPHDRLPDHQYPDGSRRLPRFRSAVPRHAGDARHLRSQSRDAWVRRDAEHRCAVRRPGDRPAERVQPGIQEDPRRHRRIQHQQERPRGGADHRRCRPHAGCADRGVAGGPHHGGYAGAGGLVAAYRSVARQGKPEIHPGHDAWRDHQAAIRHPAAVRTDAAR